MELKRAIISKGGIFRAVGLVMNLRRETPAKLDGDVYEQTKENGVVRIRMIVKKCDLEKLIDMAKVGFNDDVLVPSLVEQRLRQLRRKHHHAKLVEKKKSSSWTPALRTIPEEF